MLNLADVTGTKNNSLVNAIAAKYFAVGTSLAPFAVLTEHCEGVRVGKSAM
jgi:hypothetical protein